MKKLHLTVLTMALTMNAQSAVSWAAGAPGGTPGGSVEFEAGAAQGNGSNFLGTGVAGAAIPSYTISMWINPETTNEAWFFGTGNQGLHLGIRDTKVNDVVTAPNTLSQGHWGNDSDGTTSIAANAWSHVTYTYDNVSKTQSIYLNGELEAETVTGDPNRTTTDLIIGARTGGATNRQPFAGLVDDVAIWDSVISDADILAVADGSTGAAAAGAQAYWDFEDDQTGSTAALTGSLGAGLTGITPVVPEPSSLALTLLGAASFMRRKRA